MNICLTLMARQVLAFGVGSGVQLPSSAADFLPLTQTERAILLDCMRCIKCGVSPADGIRETAKRKVLWLSALTLCTSLLQHLQVTDSMSLSVTYPTWLLWFSFSERTSFHEMFLSVSRPQCYKHVIAFAKIQVVTCVYLNSFAVCYLSLKQFYSKETGS